MDMTLSDVGVTFTGNVLIEPSRLALNVGHRYGLIGNSGTGKTSLLLKMLAGEVKGWPEGTRTVLVPQGVKLNDPIFSNGATALEAALRATVPEDEDHPERDEKKRLENAVDMLKKMGFGPKRREQEFETLSQGWKQRLAVVCAILREPDILLMDEPSDAVDLPGLVRLERFLVSENEDRIIVVVSHDASFLENVTTDIIYIEEKKLKQFPGDYALFIQRQEEKLRAMEARVDAADRQRAAAQTFIRKQQNSLDANKQKQAKEKQDKLDRVGNYREDGRRYKTKSLKKLGDEYLRLPDKVPDKIVKEKELRFHLPDEFASLRISQDVPLITYGSANIGYPDTAPILINVTLQIFSNSRIALVGANSSGKTTLMNALCKKDPVIVSGGTVSDYPNLSVAYVPQRYGEKLGDEYGDITPAALCLDRRYFDTEQQARQHLGGFGLSGKLGVTKIKLLSGGQRTRLAIALSCAAVRPQLLILDEPSHGLDAPARVALAEALKGFPGGLLVSSHDREFIRAGGFNQLWITSKGSLKCVRARLEEDEEEQNEAFNEIFDDYLDSL